MKNKKFKYINVNDIIIKCLLLLIIFLLFLYKEKYASIGLKLCVCTYGKKENRYIREFVEYYKNMV